MKRILTSTILLLLFSQLNFAQYEESYKNQSPEALLEWIDSNYNLMEGSDHFYELLWYTLSKFLEKEDHYRIGIVHGVLSDWHYINYELFGPDSLIYHELQAVDYFLKADSLEDAGSSYLNLANSYTNNNELIEAQNATLKAIEIFENFGDGNQLAVANVRLAFLNIDLEEPEQAITYADLAFPVLYNPPIFIDTIEAINLFLTYYQAHFMLQDYDKSLEYLEQCIDFTKKNDFIQKEDVLILSYEYKGKIYIEQKKFTLAEQAFNKAWQNDIQNKGEEPAERIRYNIGLSLFFQKKYHEALPHLQAGVNGLEAFEWDISPEYFFNLSKCYKNLGDFKNALTYQDKGNELDKKITNDKIAALESEALIKYETGKKDQALAEQEVQIKQQARIQLLSWSIAGLLGILFSGLFYFFRKNQKTTAALKVKNEENELLLKEIHHRVKNNLEMVSSLLKLQSFKTTDEEAKVVMEASQNRVQSMGIIHQKLYQGENLGHIEMKDYFQNLSENLLDVFGASEKVTIKYQMEQVELDVDTAVPIGLIVNELLTNALKYAFPENSKGEIALSLSEMDEHKLKLTVEDNGIGQSNDTTIKGTGFGSQLVKLLTAQLQGSMQASYDNGTKLFFLLEKANLA